MIAVRDATEADVPFIAATQSAPHARGFVLPAREDEVRSALDRTDRMTFVITEDREPVGMVLLGRYADAPWLIDLRRFVVTRPGRSIGTHALRWVIARCFDDYDAHRITLEVVESNVVARRLYERCGFVYEGACRDGYRDPDGTYANLCMYGLLATDPR
jgi:RimJ/RimL family protein N-acetyltransferase